MKKIFAFIASPHGKDSNTYILTKMLRDYLGELSQDIDFEILTSPDLKMNYCDGCWACMKTGMCVQDGKDDILVIKRKMFEADFIIWGSPVYCGHVTGQMKVLIDRLSSWEHILALAGKPAITVSTTTETDVEIVHEYMKNRMELLGMKVLGKLDTIAFLPGMLMDPEGAIRKVGEIVQVIFPFVIGDELVKTDEKMEGIFNKLKDHLKVAKEWSPGVYNYWETNGMILLNSYAELLEQRRIR